MNAVTPPGLKAGARRTEIGRAEEEAVRLTIDFDDMEEQAAPATEPAPELSPEPAAKPARAAPRRAEPIPDEAPPSGAGMPNSTPQHPAPEAAAPQVPPQLAAIEVTLSVEVGSRLVPLRELLSVEPGQLFTLDRMTNEPVTILVNGRPFAQGEVVAMGERFGVRLIDILPGGAN
jgi:flagellar motor switch protein FliN/FliY